LNTKYLWLLPRLIKFVIKTFGIRKRLERNRTIESIEKEKYIWSKLILKVLKVNFNPNEINYSKGFSLDDNVLIICNHRSFLDILIMEQVVRKLHNQKSTFIAKKELKTTFFIGRVIELMNVMFIDRENPRDFINLLKDIKKKLKENPKGNSFIIFPEGTRNKIDNGVQKFKEGYFKIAEKNNLQILPIYIEGNPEKYLEELDGSKNEIKVHIFDLVHPMETTSEEFEELYQKEIETLKN